MKLLVSALTSDASLITCFWISSEAAKNVNDRSAKENHRGITVLYAKTSITLIDGWGMLRCNIRLIDDK